ncbi:transposase, partial [Photobacterium frigidiphilum]|uniref:transposase n=1 Tax=Photobacterium frigidiphilum TaxID=264736 RepID=UPI003D1210EB
TAHSFHNISIIKLPLYSPELNSIEQVWSWMRQHHLANQAFKDYDEILDKVCSAWNSFLSDTKRVARMCARSWTSLTS